MSDFSRLCIACNKSPCSCKTSCKPCSPVKHCAPKSCCDNVVPASATPYYAQAPGCLEDDTCIQINKSFEASVKVQNAFNMPACGMSAQLQISGLVSIAINAYLWNSGVGYLQVVAFDAYQGIATVQNNCNVGNVAVGTTIPACTIFVVTDPPALGSGSSTTGICLAIDFTAPNVGNCILITVTGVTGLAVGKNVQIGTGIYRIESIPNGTTIGICNDGAGIFPGTPVIAGDCAYPIVLIDTNPCTNPAETPGAIIICKDDVMKPLDGSGSVIGAVPRLIDPANSIAEWQALEIPTRTCTAITCCFTIVSGFAGPYTIPVADSSQFIVGDILQIGSRTDRLTVTAIPDATTVQGTLSPVPGATVDIDPGTSLCIIECCEDLQNQVDVLEVRLDQQRLSDVNDQADQGTTMAPINQLISSGGTTTFTQAGAAGTGLIINTSTIYNLVLHITHLVRIYGTFLSTGGTGTIEFVARITRTPTVGPPSTVEYGKRFGIEDSAADIPHDEFLTIPETYVLPPGFGISVDLQAKVNFNSGTPEYNIEVLSSLLAGTAIVNG